MGWGSEIRTWKHKIFEGKPDILPGPLFGCRPIWDPGESYEPAQKNPHTLNFIYNLSASYLRYKNVP